MEVDRAIQKGMHGKTTHIHTVWLAVRHSAHGVQSSAAAGAAAGTVRVGTVLCGQARGGLDQASTRQERDFMTRDLCHVFLAR